MTGEKVLAATLFGGFSARYAGEAIPLGRGEGNKASQLFQLLLCSPGFSVTKREAALSLYGADGAEDLNATMNNTLFRLRRYLARSPLPPGEYLLLGDGVITLAPLVPVRSDARELLDLGAEFSRCQDAGERTRLAKLACPLYTGAFLPRLAEEPWAAEKTRALQGAWGAMALHLLEEMKAVGDHKGMEELAAQGASIQPEGDWTLWRVGALLAQGKRQEAARRFWEYQDRLTAAGDLPAPDRLARLESFARRLRLPEDGEAAILRFLRQGREAMGASRSSLHGIRECYHLLERLRRRKGLESCLLLCAIQEMARGTPSPPRLEKQEKVLEAVVEKVLRAGDLYARYQPGQYLLLCPGCDRPSALKVVDRLDRRFQQENQGRYRVQCQVLEVKETPREQK